MNLADIAAALVTRIDAVTTLRAVAYPADSVPVGAAEVVLVTPAPLWIDYQQAFAGGLAYVNWTLELWLQMATDRSAYDRLYALTSSGTGISRSIIDVLMGTDRTLGGVCSDIVVDDVSNVRSEVSAEGARYLVADIGLRVLVGRT